MTDRLTIIIKDMSANKEVIGEGSFEMSDLMPLVNEVGDAYDPNVDDTFHFNRVFPFHEPTLLGSLEGMEDKAKVKEGDRVVIVGKCAGIVKFVGAVDFTHLSPIYGIELEKLMGTGDGSKRGKFYFKCRKGGGGLCPN